MRVAEKRGRTVSVALLVFDDSAASLESRASRLVLFFFFFQTAICLLAVVDFEGQTKNKKGTSSMQWGTSRQKVMCYL